jgi:hypothetical protein
MERKHKPARNASLNHVSQTRKQPGSKREKKNAPASPRSIKQAKGGKEKENSISRDHEQREGKLEDGRMGEGEGRRKYNMGKEEGSNKIDMSHGKAEQT